MQAPAKKPLTLIGGSARAAAVSAACGGFDVSAIDRFGDVDLRAVCRHWLPLGDPATLAAQIAQLPPAPLVPLGGCERLGSSLQQAAVGQTICGASDEQFRRSQCPATLRGIADAAGIRFAETRPANLSSQTPPAGAAANWLLKRQLRCGGLDVRRWDGHWPLPPDHHLQRYVAGRSVGVSYLATGTGTLLLGACASLRSRTAASPFAYTGSVGPLPLGAETTGQLQRLGQQATNQLGLRGLFGVDLICTRRAELYLLEINPRYSASMELLEATLLSPQLASAGQQPIATLMAAHVAAVEARAPQLPTPVARTRCKRIIYAPRDLHVPPTLDLAQPHTVSATAWGMFCDVPAHGSVIRRGHPICTCLTEAPMVPAAIRLSRQFARQLLRRWTACP